MNNLIINPEKPRSPFCNVRSKTLLGKPASRVFWLFADDMVESVKYNSLNHGMSHHLMVSIMQN